MQQVQLVLASFLPQRVTVAVDAATYDVDVPVGLSNVALPLVTTPAHITLTPHLPQALLDSAIVIHPHDSPDAEVRLWLPSAQLRALSNADMVQVLPSPDTLLINCTSRWAMLLYARCFVANPGKVELTWRWIVRGTLAGTREERVIAQREARAAPQTLIDVSAAPQNGLMGLQFDDAPWVGFEMQPIPDGMWRADLEVLQGNVLLARVELYQFEVQENGERMTRTSPQDGVLVIVQP